MLCIVVSPGIE
jgi:hypothetical protein